MSALTFTVQIAGVTYDIIYNSTFDFNPIIEQRTKFTFTVLDPTNAFNFVKGQVVTLTDSASSIQFTGTIHTALRYRVGDGNVRQHDIDCNDMHQVADERTTNRIYTNQYAGVIVAGMVNDELSGDGVTANFAIREDNTQSEFAAGTLASTVATTNLGGDLELSLAGSQVSIVESTTSNFGTGTLTNVTAASNSLSPTSTPAIKLQGTQSVPGNGNSYFYIKIWQPSSTFAVVSPGRFLAYDIWIDSSSPQAMFGVDITFTDGTNLRDTFVYTDVQDFSPHPNTDLSGVAVDQWYHREFYLANYIGKDIAYITVACEGDNAGTYTAYIKNIIYENNDHSFNQYFFGSSFNVNPPVQLYATGYSNISATIVNTCDTYESVAERVSGSYSISSVGVLRSSFISWDSNLPALTGFALSYSIDGGNSYTPCVNNSPLPNLPAGMTLTGKSIQFLEQFSQQPKVSPELFPSLYFVECILNPSYTTSKTDVLYTTASSWTGSGTTLTNTTGNAGNLNLTGVSYNWDDGQTQSSSLYSTAAAFSDGCANKGFAIAIDSTNTDAKAKLDNAGSYTNFTIDVDLAVESAFTVGVVYRTSNWGNNNDSYAYAVTVGTTNIGLGRGTNSTGSGAFTNLGGATIAVAGNNYHHLTVVVSGSTHNIYLDGILYLTVTDSTWAGPGNVGLRIYNPSGAAQQGRWDNFGIVSSLSGTWVGPNTSISGATTYGTSVVWWDEAPLNSTANIGGVLVEASLNNGSTYTACTNGGPIPGLTVGQSLSGVSVKFRVTLSSGSAFNQPGIQYFNAYVIGQFSSSGTRISPVLSLSSALIAGSTVVNWTANTLPNTTVVVATSPTGTGSWTNVSNGGAIAGITTQPQPTWDTFAVDDHTNYTNTARTGGSTGTWTFDTANSRLTIATGASALLLWTAISVSDVDIILDADQINCGGLIWRETSASNFYELDIFDSASNAGSTNIVQLYKVVANVKTQLGSNVAISFTRGTYKRFHVLMVGTAITVYMDGVQLISTTDSSLAGPGLVGMIHVSGTGSNGDSFRNFRIQPQGQSLSGINAYTRVTLTSTDPTATPQLTDLVLAALHPNIGLGSLIATANYQRTLVSANMDDLAKQSNYFWQITPTKAMIFQTRNGMPSPWILTSNDILFADDGNSTLSVENSADLYRNRMILTGVLDTLAITEIKPGDSVSTSWVLKYPVVGNPPVISLNGNPQTVGQKGIDTGKNFYYALNSTALAQDPAGAILRFGIDELTISYTGQYVTEVVRDNTGGFALTTTQSQYAALTGGAGIVEVVEDVTSQMLTVPAAQAYGDAKLQLYGVIGRTFICQTNRIGLSVGQYIPVVVPELQINDAAMLITEMDLQVEITLVGSAASMLYYWKLTCIEGPNLGSWQKTLTQILGYNPGTKGY